MSTEPKRYSPDIPMDWDLHFKESGTGSILRADDPAIVSALKDSEDLQTIQHLVGAHSVDEIKQWKRSHEAMEKLEALRNNPDAEIRIGKLVGGSTIIGAILYFLDPNYAPLPTRTFIAPSLIECIEQIPVKE